MTQLTAKALNRRITMSDLIESCDDDQNDLGALLGLDDVQEAAELLFAQEKRNRHSLSRRDIRKRSPAAVPA